MKADFEILPICLSQTWPQMWKKPPKLIENLIQFPSSKPNKEPKWIKLKMRWYPQQCNASGEKDVNFLLYSIFRTISWRCPPAYPLRKSSLDDAFLRRRKIWQKLEVKKNSNESLKQIWGQLISSMYSQRQLLYVRKTKSCMRGLFATNARCTYHDSNNPILAMFEGNELLSWR